MVQNIRRHLSFANVASLTALVLAMGGTSYALTIPRSSVGSAQIKRGGVAKSDIRRSAVTSSKVRDGGLRAKDFAAGQLPAGARGATGLQGRPGVVGAITVKREDFTVGASPSTADDATCPAGTRIIGGGVFFDAAASDIFLLTSGPYRSTVNDQALDGGSFDSWRASYANPDGAGTASVSVYAVCAQA